MHPNRIFRKVDEIRNLALAKERGFGLLSINGPTGPHIAHIPFLLSEEGRQVELHLVRSNPIARLLTSPLDAVIAVQGPYSYISPDWYEVDDQVPTWNYVAVHLRGKLEARPSEELEGMLDRLSDKFEAVLAPKRPWRSAKMTPGLMEKMMRAIVPCVLWVDAVDGTWKLNQNKDSTARLNAAEMVASDGYGVETSALAALMRDPPD